MKSQRPAVAVVFAGVNRVLRIDLKDDDAAEVHGVVERERPRDDPMLAGAVAAVLGGDRPDPEALLVLDERAWTQTLDLSSAALEGLDVSLRARALAYELEPYSGIPVDDSVVAFVCDAEASPRLAIWATQVRRADRDALVDLLAARRIRLLGIAHPAGVTGADPREARVEIWHEATCCVPRRGGAGQRLVIGARAGQRSWAERVASWLKQGNGTPVAWQGAARPDVLDDVPPTVEDRGDFGIAADPAAWARNALRAVRSAPAVLPVVPSRPREARRFLASHAALLGAILAVGLCAVDGVRLRGRVTALDGDVSAARQRADLAKRLAEDGAALEKEGEAQDEAIRGLAGPVREIETGWEAQRTRLPRLLRALAALQPEAIVLEEIKPDGQGLSIRGLGLDHAAIDRFAVDLGAEMKGAFDVRPASVTAAKEGNSARLSAFVLRLVPGSSP